MARTPGDFAPLTPSPVGSRLLSGQGRALEPPLRSVLFGAARFAEHGRSLAQAQDVAGPHERRGTFFPRLHENMQVLRDARALLEEHARQGHHLAPAAGWLMDNGLLLEQQLETVRDGLPRRYFEKLPRLRGEPLAGLPRVYGIAWNWVAHTDSGVDETLLEAFLGAYQSERELTLAELWAIPTTLRVVLVENLRRLAERAATVQAALDAAHRWVELPPGPGKIELLKRIGVALQQRGVLEAFALQLQRRSAEWSADITADTRSWLTTHLSDSAGALQRQQQQAAEDHHSVRNAVTALRTLDRLDWRGLFMRSSAVLGELQRLPVFAAESEATQDQALRALERLARRAALPESQVGAAVARLAARASGGARAPLHWLTGPGRSALRRELGLPAMAWQGRALAALRRVATPVYLLSLLLATAGVVLAVLQGHAPAPAWAFGISALLLAWPASEAVVAALHRLLSESVPPRRLPRLALDDGIPVAQRPLVVVPAMLTHAGAVQALAARLEQHHLANPERHAQFALLSDWADAPAQHSAGDMALLQAAQAAIESLNHRYPAGPDAPLRFLLLHRERRWCDSEQCWMGWERKRGKLEALVSWLAEQQNSPFLDLGAVSTPAPAIRSVVTLDSDTDMPPGRLRELVAVASHPLNLPEIDAVTRRVVQGYGILQPRVTAPLPAPGSITPFYWLFSGQWGVDPYSVPSSEIYEDLFAEGSFTGKGLLDVKACHAMLSHRLPDSHVLSHDLLEGALARCAMVSDITLVEDPPAHPDVAASRLHRWTRGDWQLLPFVARPAAWPMAGINRWKMTDNLRRSLVAPMSLLLLLWVLASGLLSLPVVLWLVLAAYGAGPLLGALAGLAPERDDLALGLFFRRALVEVLRAALGAVWRLAQLLSSALMYADAVARALLRQYVTHRHLLQWTTAAAAEASASTELPALWRRHARVTAAAVPILLLLVGARIGGLPVDLGWAIVLCGLWAAAPLWTWLACRRFPAPVEHLDESDRELVRALAVDTWRYFERHVGDADNHLPPDNVQMTPQTMVAHRSSPTNIGLYLVATAAAREMGFIGLVDMVDRLEHTLATLDRLPRWRGHFYNWYETQTLALLTPAYVSTVDSGNLSASLLVMAAACEELAAQAAWDDAPRAALAASAHRLQPLVPAIVGAPALAALVRRCELGEADCSDELREQLATARRELDALLQGRPLPESGGAMRRLHDHVALLDAWLRDCNADVAPLRARLLRLAAHGRTLALAADFSALYDPRRRLLHIGYRVENEQLDDSHYDLLASESRLGSLVAIAKGDLPPRHWAALGRPFFAALGGVGLKSWSGSMFEYLMPSLLLAEPAGSLLHQAVRSAVAEQRAEGRARGTPWGISESAIAVQDHTLAYQYGPQGVGRLALRRTPPDERVVAPYASVMALVVAPREAVQNLRALETLGVRRGLGFIESLDYTPHRQPAAPDAGHAGFTPVDTFMAHHQAMSLLACAHLLTAGCVQRWAAADPHLRAVSWLLHERAPHQAPRLRERPVPELPSAAPRLRWQLECEPRRTPVPPTHLLGNGRYALALRANGAGFSQWQGQGLTRWRDDALRDLHGLFGYVQRAHDARWASLSARPAPDDQADYRTEFHPDRVLLHAQWPDLLATTTVSVSTEDDCELRRVVLHNTGRRPLTLTLAMAFEATLAPQRADEAHPAFSNLFVQARWSADERAMFLQRKPRLAQDPALHAVHFLAASDGPLLDVEICADRARWLGRLGSVVNPLGEMATGVGLGDDIALETGLDPVSVIAVRLSVPPGGIRTLTFGLGCAAEEEALHALVDRFRHEAGAQRALGLSDTLARIRLRELRLDADTWGAWLQMNTLLVNAVTRPLTVAAEGTDRRLLWRHAISGDRPIVALWVEGAEGVELARQLVSLLPQWTAGGVALDLVVVNAEPPSYLAPVQQAFATLAELAALRTDPQVAPERRAVLKLLNARDLQGGEATALRLLARVVLQADGRSLAQQIERLRALHDDDLADRNRPSHRAILQQAPDADATAPGGRFEGADAAYRFSVSPSQYPLRPWVNVLANRDFGCQVSEAAAGFTWAGNSRMHQVTGWSNDALCDPPSEAVLLQDLDSQRVWLLGRGLDAPGRDVLHGIGSTRMRHVVDGLDIELCWCVDAEAAVKQLQIAITVRQGPPRRLRLVGYAEWTLGASRAERASLVTRPQRWDQGFALQATQLDAGGGHGGATAFLGWRLQDDSAGTRVEPDDWSCDRREFFDGDGRWVLPSRLRSRAGAGLDACAALACSLALGVGRTAQLALLLGHADSAEAAAALAQSAWAEAPAQRLARQRAVWPALLGAIEVRTPDPLFDALVNRWLPYQAVACRLWARAGFYQAGGAFGFRDQLQDAMCLADRAPQLLQQQIALHAAHQFVEGDVQHWWHMPSGAGVRTKMSDDLLWLPFAVAHSVRRSGDSALLDETVPFLRGPPVPEHSEDVYDVPAVADERGTVYEHAARAIDHSLRTGTHGLPLIGTGDWNDGMNRIGHEGRGESVWLGWFMCRVIDDFAPLAERRGDAARARRWRTARTALAGALESAGWDGQWYRRAFFDDGTPLGSAANSECRIDLIAQAWAVLSQAGAPERAAQAMDSAGRLLWDAGAGVLQLLDPPLAAAEPSAGYIQAYPPGIRENGGQYNHAGVWALMAFAQLGDAASAWRVFTALSPAHRSIDPRLGPLYALEPYVAAGDVYSQPPYAGRGGWSWYTGSAAWLQRAALESICGLLVEGATMTLRPCLPPHWPQADITLRRDGHSHRVTLCRDGAVAQVLQQQNPRALRAQPGERIDLAALPDGSHHVVVADAVSQGVPEVAASAA